MHKHAICRYI